VLKYVLTWAGTPRPQLSLRAGEVLSSDLEKGLSYTRAGAARTLRRLQKNGWLRRRPVKGRRPKGYRRYTNLHGVRRKRRVDRRKREFLGYAYCLSPKAFDWLIEHA
jgi:hypothetical protein